MSLVDQNSKNKKRKLENFDEKLQTQNVQVLAHAIESNVQIDSIDKMQNEVLIQTLSIKLQKLKDISKVKETEIDKLRAKQETLRNELNNELVYIPKIQREMEYNVSMVNMMKQHFTKLNSEYKSLIFPLNNLKADIERNFCKQQSTMKMLLDNFASSEEAIKDIEIKLEENENKFLQFIQNANSNEELLRNKIEILEKKLEKTVVQIEELESQELICLKTYEDKRILKDELECYLNSLDVDKILEEKSTMEQNQQQAISNVKKNIVQTKTTIQSINAEIEDTQRKDELEINLAIEQDAKQQAILQKFEKLQEENNEVVNKLQRTKEENDSNLTALTIQMNDAKVQIENIDNDIHRSINEDIQLYEEIKEIQNNHLLVKMNQLSLEVQLNDLTRQLNEKTVLLSQSNDDDIKLKEQLNEIIDTKNKFDKDLSDLKKAYAESSTLLKNKFKELINENNNQQIKYERIIYEKKQEMERLKEELANELTNVNTAWESSIQLLNKKLDEAKESLQDIKQREIDLKEGLDKQEETNHKLVIKRDNLFKQKDALLKSQEKCMKDNITKPTGILKCINRTPIKRVSFQQNLNWESSESSMDDKMPDSQVSKSAEDLWNEMVVKTHSPPEKL